MRSVTQWFDEYSESHRNPLNKRLHWICVPAIVLSVVGLLWSLPVPASFAAISPWLNWATIVAGLSLAYYFALSPRLAIGVLLGYGVLFGLVQGLAQLPWPLWATSVAIFVVAWIGQFIGHAYEGKRPSFYKDLQFLLIGPLWLLGFVYRSLGLRYH